MKPVHAAVLAADALCPPIDPSILVAAPVGARCAATGMALDGVGAPFSIPKSFNDAFLLEAPSSPFLHPAAARLFVTKDAQTGHSASGVVSASGFQRLLSNDERIAFLMDPPEPPFAVAFVTAQRQHVWWMARVAYDRDLVPIQFGHRRWVVDRPRAIAAARAILDYERTTAGRDGKTTYVFAPAPKDRDYLATSRGVPTVRFQQDGSDEAAALRSTLAGLSPGDLWAASQIRAAVRAHDVHDPETALAAIASKAGAAAGTPKENHP